MPAHHRMYHVCELVEAESEAVVGHIVLQDFLVVFLPDGQPGVLLILAGVHSVVLHLPALPFVLQNGAPAGQRTDQDQQETIAHNFLLLELNEKQVMFAFMQFPPCCTACTIASPSFCARRCRGGANRVTHALKSGVTRTNSRSLYINNGSVGVAAADRSPHGLSLCRGRVHRRATLPLVRMARRAGAATHPHQDE